MPANRTVLGRLTSMEVNPWTLFTDLLAFLGLFAVVLYTSGYNYMSAYYSKFFLPQSPSWTYHYVSNLFLNEVVLSSLPVFVLLLVGFSFLALFFFVARNLFRAWFAYLSLCLMVLMVLFGGAMAGRAIGSYRGERDWIQGTTRLSAVSVVPRDPRKLHIELKEQIDRNVLYLLLDDGEFLYLFAPLAGVEDQSIRQVYRLSLQDVSQVIHKE